MAGYQEENTVPRIRHWSDAKLDKELAFATAALDRNHPENVEWFRALTAEAQRRAVNSIRRP